MVDLVGSTCFMWIHFEIGNFTMNIAVDLLDNTA